MEYILFILVAIDFTRGWKKDELKKLNILIFNL